MAVAGSWSSQRALAAHFEGAQAYAAGCWKKSVSCLMSFGKVLASPSAGRSPACSGRTTIPATVPTSTPSTCPASCSRGSACQTRWLVTGRRSRRDRARWLQTASAGPAQASCLFVADTGDNDQVRPEVTIYIVVEPKVGGSEPSSTVAARSLRFRYPRGPTDAEAIAVRAERRPHDRLQGAQWHDRLLRRSRCRRCPRACVRRDPHGARQAATPAFGPIRRPAGW